jgi:tetratricopeptide (TPR) repeat protein
MKKLLYGAVIVLLSAAGALASYDEALKLYQEKKFRESLDSIASELSVDQDFQQNSPNYALRFLAAHNHWKMGNHEAAIAHFRRCADIQKDTSRSSDRPGTLLIDIGRYWEAEPFAQRALALQKNPIAYYVVAKSAYGVGNFWRSKEFFEKSISMDPEFFVAYNGLRDDPDAAGEIHTGKHRIRRGAGRGAFLARASKQYGSVFREDGKRRKPLEYYIKRRKDRAPKIRPSGRTLEPCPAPWSLPAADRGDAGTCTPG